MTKKEMLTEAIEQTTGKVHDSTPDGVRRLIRRFQHAGMSAGQLESKLTHFQGNTIADLDQHLQSRNVGRGPRFLPEIGSAPRSTTPDLTWIEYHVR